MTPPGLELHQLSLQLGGFALRDVDLAVAPGEILVLLGRNGAGKSVCLEAIAGFHKLSRGRVWIAGSDVTDLPPERRRIGFMVQSFGLFPHLSVRENVSIAADKRSDPAAIESLLARFGIAHLSGARPVHLSPGEKQRTALARALVSHPDLFLFDEPFAALDAVTSGALREELGTFLRRTGVATVFVTHDRGEALTLADRIAVLDDGAVVQQGPAAEVFAQPRTIALAQFLGVENLIAARVETIESDRVHLTVGQASLIVPRRDPRLTPGQSVTLAIRAENIHLHPPDSTGSGDPFAARVVALRRAGPLWTVALDAGFPLEAYALPQTLEASALAPGRSVIATIDPDAVHVIPEQMRTAP